MEAAQMSTSRLLKEEGPTHEGRSLTRAGLCVSVCLCLSVCVCLCMCVSVCICMSFWLSPSVCLCMHLSVSICLCRSVYVCLPVSSLRLCLSVFLSHSLYYNHHLALYD